MILLKLAAAILILLAGWLTDNMLFAAAVILGWFAFFHFLQRSFIATIAIAALALWTGYQAILGDRNVGDEVVMTLLAMGVLVAAWKVFSAKGH